MARKRSRSSVYDRNIDDYLLEYETNGSVMPQEPTCKQRCCRGCIIISIVLLVLALLIFLSIFVILPTVFMYSIELQRNLVFEQYTNNKDREFTNFRKYGIEATRNLYVNVNTGGQTITLGVWHVLPLALLYEAEQNENYSYEEALRSITYPVLLYFHDSSGNRIMDINKYRIFRRFFHVIAFDYRSYGDSTEAELLEELVARDAVHVYKWLRSQTKAEIFVWGHSLGAGLSTNMIVKLRKEGLIPQGLFLEAPFTTLSEELLYHPTTKLFAWLPWFETMILDPLKENGFVFKTNESLLSVDCPIMIVHAEDDSVVPCFLGEKLVSIAREMRDPGIQGNVTFYLFPAHFEYGHDNIYQALELTDYIKGHIDVCREHNGRLH